MTHIITQLEETTSPLIVDHDDPLDETQLPPILNLNVRGERIDIERLLLPESIILHLFPNGIDLSLPNEMDSGAHVESTVAVDFDPSCFAYIKRVFEETQKAKREQLASNPPTSPLPGRPAILSLDTPDSLVNRQVVIALREDLEYFVLPPRHTPVAEQDIHRIKYQAGQHLMQDNKMFEPLLKNIKKENNLAELHLVEMLCEAGFDQDDRWFHRNQEPKRTCITSLSLLRFATSPATDPDQHSALVAQRLMPFWKKPARKCWWDVGSLTLDTMEIKVWKRRTWTLEFILV
ncbi:hypothetical protein DM01DRAFT_1297787 [Hesseltinella vesiculosa]|uniref:Phosphatase activator n=1 Tax=Hesseltinella vesiculosa TaxID=101127 RepID=A0A1X2GZ11_9FUNG|nr:hypothetical protein DM01DRAFT_1297787 [Hesseltinella vesiculosa]